MKWTLPMNQWPMAMATLAFETLILPVRVRVKVLNSFWIAADFRVLHGIGLYDTIKRNLAGRGWHYALWQYAIHDDDPRHHKERLSLCLSVHSLVENAFSGLVLIHPLGLRTAVRALTLLFSAGLNDEWMNENMEMNPQSSCRQCTVQCVV